MYKRLTISLVLMGLAAFSLAAGAFAWFSTDGQAQNVTISAATIDLEFYPSDDCQNYAPEAVANDLLEMPQWSNVIPGETARDCVRIENNSDVPLDVFIDHRNVTGLLKDVVTVTYSTHPEDRRSFEEVCGGAGALTAGKFQQSGSDKGCSLGTIAARHSLYLEIVLSFPNNGQQNDLQGKKAVFDGFITGYTPLS